MRNHRGFTVVELMIVVFVIGVLAAVAIPGFRNYRLRALTAEAVLDLNKLVTGAVVYYQADHVAPDGTTLPRQFPGNTTTGVELEESLAGLLVVDCACRPRGKCDGGHPIWGSDFWMALKFAKPNAHVYLSEARVPMPLLGPLGGLLGPLPPPQFTASDIGDLDCDGRRSRFVRIVTVDPATSDPVIGQMGTVNAGE